jgi:pantothenate synthetase
MTKSETKQLCADLQKIDQTCDRNEQLAELIADEVQRLLAEYKELQEDYTDLCEAAVDIVSHWCPRSEILVVCDRIPSDCSFCEGCLTRNLKLAVEKAKGGTS